MPLVEGRLPFPLPSFSLVLPRELISVNMPVFQLTEELIFPHPELASEDGLLAIGGDLSVERLLLAYANGIFPWFEDGGPILWWTLNPRLVLFPEQLKVSPSLRQTINSRKFTITFDGQFEEVIKNCAVVPRREQDGTWITSEMQKAYVDLYRAGFAHSVEVKYNNKLVGGLYGVSLGRFFFGESMFYHVRDASKVALFYLVEKLKHWNFIGIDAQQDTPHMRRMGAEAISRKQYLELLEESMKYPTKSSEWRC